MSPERIRIVRRSFQSVAAARDAAAAAFFDHLFGIDPALRLFFPGDLRRRGAKLVNAVGLVVEELHRPHVFVPALEALALRLAASGLEPSAYDAFGEALRRTARSLLGLGFSFEVESALDEAYSGIRDVMVGAAFQELRLAA